MASEIFPVIEAMFTGQTLAEDAKPPMYVIHRFLASDPRYAVLAMELQKDVRDPAMMFRVWQLAVGRQSGAPRGLSYVGPRKQAEAEELVRRLMQHFNCSRTQAEDMMATLAARDRVEAACRDFGIETKASKAAAPKDMRKPATPQKPRTRKPK
jgi:hypothetical protein